MSSSTTLLHGKKILIIGGSSGIGKAVAAAALAHGAFVVISSSSQKRVEAAVAELKTVGANVSGAAFDVKDAQALKNFLTAQGSFDHLVDTAGEAHPGTFPQEDITEQTRGNFDLINPGGSITMSIGTVFNRPIPGWALVSGVAGAMESATRGLAMDLKPIRVNTISPGIVDTEFWDATPQDAKAGIFSHYEKNLLVGHIGTPAEVAEAYIFTMKCSYLTSQIITVDGGGSLV